jgi:hypothetical protein
LQKAVILRIYYIEGVSGALTHERTLEIQFMGSAVLWLRRFLGLALLTTGSVTPIDCMPLLGGIGDYSLASRPRIIIRSGFVGGRSPHWIKVKIRMRQR